MKKNIMVRKTSHPKGLPKRFGKSGTIPNGSKKIKIQAKKNNKSIDKTLEDNAIYVLKRLKESNWRKRRNPRAGTYSFIIVLVDSSQLNSLPDHVINIGKKTTVGTYTNPYKYFNNSHEKRCLAALIADKQLKTFMVFSPNNGVVSRKPLPENEKTCNCGNSEELKKKAHYSEFWSD